MKNKVESKVGLLHKLSINETNYRGEKNLEMIDMMADRKFTEKAIKFKDVLFMKKENYIKKLCNFIQLYKKENKVTNSCNNPELSSSKNLQEIVSLRRRSRASILDFSKLNFQTSHKNNMSMSSKIINHNKISTNLNTNRKSISTYKNKSIENFFDGIISPSIDFDKNEGGNFLNEEEIKKRQMFLKSNKNKNAATVKKPLPKTLSQYGTDYIFLKNEKDKNNDLFLMLKNSLYIKKMRDFSIVREDDRMFKEFTKYVRDIYNIKPPCITIFQSINEIREMEMKKSNSISNIKQNNNDQFSYPDSIIPERKSKSKNSFFSFKNLKTKSRNITKHSKQQDLYKTYNDYPKKEVLKKESPLRKDFKSLLDNIDNNFRSSQTLLKENVHIHKSNNELLKKTFSNTFSTINNDFGKNGLMKQTSMDFIKQFTKKGDFIYGKTSGFYASSKTIINPVLNQIKQPHK